MRICIIHGIRCLNRQWHRTPRRGGGRVPEYPMTRMMRRPKYVYAEDAGHLLCIPHRKWGDAEGAEGIRPFPAMYGFTIV